MKNEESRLQMNCVKLFRLQNREISHLLFSIPNGGYRSKTIAGIMKAEGVVSGVPDLFLAIPKGQYAGLFIEMKTPKGVVSDNQKMMIEALKKQGYAVEICRTIPDFMETTEKYLKP